MHDARPSIQGQQWDYEYLVYAGDLEVEAGNDAERIVADVESGVFQIQRFDNKTGEILQAIELNAHTIPDYLHALGETLAFAAANEPSLWETADSSSLHSGGDDRRSELADRLESHDE